MRLSTKSLFVVALFALLVCSLGNVNAGWFRDRECRKAKRSGNCVQAEAQVQQVQQMSATSSMTYVSTEQSVGSTCTTGTCGMQSPITFAPRSEPALPRLFNPPVVGAFPQMQFNGPILGNCANGTCR